MDSDSSHQAILPSLPLGTNARRPIILNDLPELIRIRIVCELEHISFLDVLSFAQSTKALRKVALSKIYRSIRLMPCLENKKDSTTYRALIDLFRNDAQCEIARHVHSIAIHDGVPAEDVILLLERTAGHGTLGKFSWNTSTHMPDIVFDRLHAVRPILQLSVAIFDRRISKEAPYYKLDMRIFTSPLLTDLTYAVYSDSTESENPKRPRLPSSTTPSGPKSLRSPKEMIDSARLETLTTTNGKDFVSINLDDETRSAVLDELSRQCEHKENGFAYQLRSHNGRVLHESINCTNICALDFGEVNPEVFFTVLKGAIPGLKMLRFGTCGGSRARTPAVDFIQSVIALEGLHFTHLCSVDEFGPAIVKHKDSLQTLDLGSQFHAWHCIASIGRDSTPLFHGEEIIMRLTRSRKGRARKFA